MKKLFAMLLAVVMVLGLVACTVETPGNTTTKPDVPGNTTTNPTTTTEPDLYYNKTGLPICDEVITIKVSGTIGNTTNWNDTFMVKWVEENLGIKMECEPVSKDVRETKYGLWLTNPEEMPDLIINAIGASKAQVDKDGADGFWLNLAEYTELMPNMLAYFDKYPSLGDYVTNADGSIYSLTRITSSASANINNQIYYHIPTLEAAGVDGSKIKTVDDLYNALVKLKAYYPDKIPYLITPGKEPAYRNELNLRTAFGVYSNDNHFMVVTGKDGKVSLADISSEHRDYLKFVNKLQKEGLIDITDITREKTDIQADIKNGKYCFYTDQVVPFTDAEQALKDKGDASWMENFGIIAAMTSEKVTETTYIRNNGIQDAARVMVAANTEYPEAIARLLDFFFSEEGQVFAVQGVEGETFDWKVDEYGIKTPNYDKYWDKANYDSAATWAVQNIVINQGLAFNWGFIGAIDTLTEAEMAAIPASSGHKWTIRRLEAVNSCDNSILAAAPWIFSAEQTEEAGSLPTDLKSFLETAKIEFINGTRDPNSDADWNAFVKQVNDMGWTKLQPIYQECVG